MYHFERAEFAMPAPKPAASREWRRRPASLIAICTALFAASSCAESGRSPDRAPTHGFVKAPPKPGSSISHTRMCECHACSPRDCCDGTDETQVTDESCHTDYDFTKQDACGIKVRSCTTRCSREIWRVKLNEDCEVRRPASCCG